MLLTTSALSMRSVPLLQNGSFASPTLRRLVTASGSRGYFNHEVRISKLETARKELTRTVSDMQKTDRSLLQIVDQKGSKYESKFSEQLEEFAKKLQPLEASIQDVRREQRDMQNTLSFIQWGGTLFATIVTACSTVFGFSDKLHMLRPVFSTAALILGIAYLLFAWQKHNDSKANNHLEQGHTSAKSPDRLVT